MGNLDHLKAGVSWSNKPITVQSNNVGAISEKSAYQKLLDANPYRNITYQKSPWQNFLSALGFRTQADAWTENMNVQAREYDAAILQKQYDEQYNDPQSQVARERAAGLNPDINGGQSIDPGSAAPLGEDPSTPMETTGEEGVLGQFANGIMNVFSSSLGILQSFQGLNRNHLQNTLLALQNESDFTAYANGLASRFLPNKSDSVIDEDTGAAHSWQEIALQSASLFAHRSLPKKMRNKFIAQVQSFWNGAPGDAEAYKTWKSVQEERFGYGVSRGKYGDLTIDDVLFGIAERLGPLAMEQLESGLNREVAENNASIEKAGYEGELYQHLDSQAAASAANSSNRSTIELNEVQSKLRKSMRDILDYLKDASSGSGIGAGLAKIAYALMSMQSFGMLPSVSVPGVGSLNF